MLYRLDYDDAEGGAVADPILGGDYICRHMTTARAKAREVAAAEGRSVLVSRIGKAGAIRPSLVFRPDATASRPGGMEGEDCTAGTGRTCFCRNCRAGRRKTPTEVRHLSDGSVSIEAADPNY